MEQVKLFKTFSQMLETLPDDQACREYLEGIRWNREPTCPHCSDKGHYRLNTKGIFRGQYKCKNCKERYTVTVGTMFEGSHIGLRKWFIAVYIFSSHKKGISSHQLAADLGITQKSAWFMLSRIRLVFKPAKQSKKIEGHVSVDESFIGGKNKNRHADKKVENNQGRSVKDKTPVFGMIENGEIIHTVVIPDTKGETLKPIIKEMVEKGAIVVSDEWLGYSGLDGHFNHVVLNHKAKEFVRDGFSTNNVENFWSMLKRGIYGIYHHASAKHLHRYTDEFAFRYNTRKVGHSDRFDMSLVKTEGNRLTYKQLIAK